MDKYTCHSGGSDALPIWIDIMKEIHEDLPIRGFVRPAGVVKKQICHRFDDANRRLCRDISEDYYVSAYAPQGEYADDDEGWYQRNQNASRFGNLDGRRSRPKQLDPRVRKTF